MVNGSQQMPAFFARKELEAMDVKSFAGSIRLGLEYPRKIKQN